MCVACEMTRALIRASQVRLYEVNSQGQSQPKAMYSHEAPVLDLCWSKVRSVHLHVPCADRSSHLQSGTQVISAGCDNAARCYDTATGQSSQVAAHDGPIKCIRWVDMPNGSGENGVLVTAGWDKKLKVSYGGKDLDRSRLSVSRADLVLVLGYAIIKSDCAGRPSRASVRYGCVRAVTCKCLLQYPLCLSQRSWVLPTDRF